MPEQQPAGCQPGELAAGSRGHYPRLFPQLPPWRAAGQTAAEQQAQLCALARTLMETSDPPRENPRIPAGFTYFGQFMNHDLSHMRPIGPGATNQRTPAFDLDSVYGPIGKEQSAALDARGRFRGREDTAAVGLPEPDLYRVKRAAQIPEPRNDEHVIISQLHVCVQRFHNAVMDRLESGAGGPVDPGLAQTLVRRHYQWVVLHDYLPRLVGRGLVRALWSDLGPPRLGRYPLGGKGFIPSEFAAGVFRMGHSMARPSYRLSPRTNQIPLFVPGEREPDSMEDLRGRRPLIKTWRVNWSHFVERSVLHEDGTWRRGRSTSCQPSMALDLSVALPLDALPEAGVDGSSLLLRDLQASLSCQLASGQDIAAELGIAPLSNTELGVPLPDEQGCPLLLYVLGEAARLCEGTRLGPLGGRLLAETVLGVMYADKSSILHDHGWRPDFAVGGEFLLSDFVVTADRLERGLFGELGMVGGPPDPQGPEGGHEQRGELGGLGIAAN